MHEPVKGSRMTSGNDTNTQWNYAIMRPRDGCKGRVVAVALYATRPARKRWSDVSMVPIYRRGGRRAVQCTMDGVAPCACGDRVTISRTCEVACSSIVMGAWDDGSYDADMSVMLGLPYGAQVSLNVRPSGRSGRTAEMLCCAGAKVS